MHICIPCRALDMRSRQADFDDIQLRHIKTADCALICLEERRNAGCFQMFTYMPEVPFIRAENINGQPERAGVL